MFRVIALRPSFRPNSPRAAIRTRNRTTGTRHMGTMKGLSPIPVGPQPCRHRRQREGRRVGKMAARNECGSEQLPYEFSNTSLAHLKRGITDRKWVEACSWMESRLSKHHAYRPRFSGMIGWNYKVNHYRYSLPVSRLIRCRVLSISGAPRQMKSRKKPFARSLFSTVRPTFGRKY